MQSNHTKSLIKVLNELNIPYKNIHRDNNLIEVIINSKTYHFNYSKIPLNDAVVHSLCQDKEYTYSLLKDKVNMPKTLGYVDPNITAAFSDYVRFESIQDISEDISKELHYPIIIKPNKGSGGINAFKCLNLEDTKNALQVIYNQESKHYDYVALAQKYIDIKEEYRVITLDSKIQFFYKKDNSDSDFTGNISPLHFSGAKAVLMKNEELRMKIEKFIEPIFQSIQLKYSGLDIAVDSNGKMYLIEINGSPQFDIFIRDNGDAEVMQLYRDVVELL